MKFMSSAFRKLLLYLWDENVLNDKRFFEEPNIEHLIKNWKSPNIKKTISKEDLPLYMNRISQELEILASFENDNYFKYFVILKDITEFLKDKNYQISMGRGSAASSFVAYMMGLHQVDPIKHNLYFERFLNKNRKDYPDIDLNMSAEAKEELLKYLDVKYKGKTATVKVFNKIGKKGAIANTLRIVGYKTEEINNISKKIDEIAYDMENLEDMEDLNDLDNVQQDFDTIPEELEKIYEEKPLLRNLIEKQVGEVSNYILHPSAIFIDSENFNYDVEYKDGMKVLNIDQNINKIKFDFLNSKNLAIVETAIKYLDKESQFVYSKDLDFENKEIWDNLLKINYIGIPELDSEKKVIRESKEKYLKQVEPRNIDELSDFLALIRPGALESKKEYLNNRKIEFLYTNKNENFKEVYFQYKTIFEKELNIKEWKELLKWREKSQNPQLEQLKSFLRQKLHNNYEEQNMIEDFIKNKVKYLSKNDLEKELESNEKYRQITKNTYGTIIYQEQIMEILNIMGGIPLDETNEIRKAISKKKTTEIAKFKEEVINTLSNSNKNLSKEAIEYLFNKIETSSKYAFNKSHSVAYAMNSYSFLYLKIKHYPVFYLAVKEHKPKLDLEINSKDSYKAIINYSKENYTIVKNRIVEPMKTVNLFKTNKAAMLEILEKQPFKNFTDMMNKVNRQVINKSVIKELMKVGYLYKGFFKESEETLNKIFGDETKKVLHECNLDLM
jgi:DNA polymerase-3 subunit alpha